MAPETAVVDIAPLAQEMGIPIGANPMKPGDMVIHPSFTRMPPKCPVCQALLYPTQQSPTTGNLLFECLNGDLANAGHYMAVYQVGTNTWGQRPGAERKGWVPPGIAKVKGVKLPKRKKVVKLARKFTGTDIVPGAGLKSKRKKGKAKAKVKHRLVTETMPQDG
jgi:hypothetical protein